MASPQTEDGHIQIATELIEALAGIRISGEEMQCLWVIIRKTYGWKKKTDWIALSQFVEITGINKGNVGRALRRLLAKNMVVKKDYHYGVSYGIQKNYKKWKPLSKKTTGSQKRLKVSSKKTTTKDTNTKEIKDIVEYFNNKIGTAYRPTGKQIQKFISARVSDGFSVEDFKKVIDVKSAEWKHSDMKKYLRPETLFGTKFESYLNQKEITAQPEFNH